MTRVFITGGGSGLGRALALRYAAEGAQVCVGDVDPEGREGTLEALGAMGATGLAVACDVRHPDALDDAARKLESTWGGVDVLVNNAGVAISGPEASVSAEDWRWIVDVNLLGVVNGCRSFLPMMRRQGRGHILNIASLAGLVPFPMAGAYNATKAAVVAYSETLRAEVIADGVDVTVVCPWFFRTGIATSARMADTYADVTRRLISEARMGADEVADRIVREAHARPMHVLPQAEARLLWLLKRWLPWSASSSLFGAFVSRARARDAARTDWQPYRRPRE